jgi:lambda repressor-like predicted transcriptional regulator
VAGVTELEHGTRPTYVNHGCRCDDCCKANTAYFRRYYNRGQRYPLEALTDASGLSEAALVRQVGMSGSTLKRVRVEGLSEAQADRYACRLGLVPWMVWPNWLADAQVPCKECGELFVPKRKGHVYCTIKCCRRVHDREHKRKRRLRDPEWAERDRERSRRYRESAAKAIRVKDAARRERNREAERERAKAYYAANAERVKARVRAYRERQKDAA